MESHMTIDQIWENIKTSIMLKKSCSNDTVDKKNHNNRAVGNKTIINILTISFVRAFRGLGLNESVPSSYKRVQEVTRKPKARKRKEEEEKNLANHIFFFFIFLIEINGHP